MNRHERLRAAVSGQTPDRVPLSAWGHFFDKETSAERFAAAMLDFVEAYDWDFVKVHARASYHVEGWGFNYEPSTDPAKGHVCTSHPIRSVGDWRKLRPLPLDSAPFAEQFRALDLIRERVRGERPVIMTVFSPLDVAEKLVDRDSALLKRHIEEDMEALEAALVVIAETFAVFVRELTRHGVDGIYFSTKWANDRKLTAEQYSRLVRPHDLKVLHEAQSMWCNMLHLCEDHVQLEAMADYPVQLFHWDVNAPHNPSFSEGRGQVPIRAALGGGVDAATLANGRPEDVEAKLADAIRHTGGRGFVAGPGCSVQIAKTPRENLLAMRRAVTSSLT